MRPNLPCNTRPAYSRCKKHLTFFSLRCTQYLLKSNKPYKDLIYSCLFDSLVGSTTLKQVSIFECYSALKGNHLIKECYSSSQLTLEIVIYLPTSVKIMQVYNVQHAFEGPFWIIYYYADNKIKICIWLFDGYIKIVLQSSFLLLHSMLLSPFNYSAAVYYH